MHKIKSQLMDELKKYERMEKLPSGSLDVIHKITDTIKNIDKIEMLEDGEGSYDFDEGSSYRRNTHRDALGRYSRESEGRHSEGYSRNKDHIMSTFDEMIESASGKEKEILMRCMKEIERI